MPSARYDGRPGHSCLKRFDAGTTTLLKFRHLLERHELPRAMLGEINAVFAQKGLLLRQGTIVDATIIHAPSSTKNESQARDPEMKQTKKGKAWHGMKAHIGVDLLRGWCTRSRARA